VLSTIAICGGGFDVATSAEVALLQHFGLPIDRCIYTNPIKKPVDIDVAYAAGIRMFVVENPCEAQKFAGRPADIAAPWTSSRTSARASVCTVA
jgi:ornithine decarboxylase